RLYAVKAVRIVFGEYCRRGIGAAPKWRLQVGQKNRWMHPSLVCRRPALMPKWPHRGHTEAGDGEDVERRIRSRVVWCVRPCIGQERPAANWIQSASRHSE